MNAYLDQLALVAEGAFMDRGDGQAIDAGQQQQLAQLRARCADVLQPRHIDLFVLRYLVGMDFDLDKAEAMLRTHLQWRTANDADAPLQQLLDSVPPRVKRYMPTPTPYGESLEGYPVYWDLPGSVDVQGVAKSMTAEEVVRYHGLVFQEAAYERMRLQTKKHGRMVDRIIVVSDLTNIGMSTLHSPFVAMMKQVTRTRTENYPQVLKHMVIINAPTIINMLYTVAKPLLAERTRRKIIFVKEKPEKFLPTIIDRQYIPQRYGGLAPDLIGPVSPVPASEYLSNRNADGSVKITLSRNKEEVVLAIAKAGDVLNWTIKCTRPLDMQLYLADQGDDRKAVDIVVAKQRLELTASAGTHSGRHVCTSEGPYVLLLGNSTASSADCQVLFTAAGAANADRHTAGAASLKRSSDPEAQRAESEAGLYGRLAFV